MGITRPSNGTLLGGIALFVALGGTALAATGTLVNIADPDNASRVARVDPSGGLRVSDGAGRLTIDGYTQDAPVRDFWRDSGTIASGCTTIATPPAGKAIVLRQVTVNVFSAPAGTLDGDEFIPIYAAAGCGGSPIWDVTPSELGPETVEFDPGVAIPANGALSALDYQGAGLEAEVYATGYTVPSNVVPSSPAVAPQDGGSDAGVPAEGG